MVTDSANVEDISHSRQTGPEVEWELVRQFRRAVRLFWWVAGIAAAVVALVVAAEVVRFYDLFARVHWLAGYAYLAAVTVALVLGVGVPVWRYLRLPAVVRPPDVDLDATEITAEDLARRCRFVERYCRALLRNPELSEQASRIEEAAEAARGLQRRAAAGGRADILQLVSDLKQLENEHVDALLKPLDERVDAYIRKEALAVGFATAVSMNGTLDAFIVLWRNVNMVCRIGRHYYGRPGLRGSLLIVRDVGIVVAVSRAMDDLTDMAGDLAGRMLGNLGGIIVGPVVDGTVNALMTMKVGHLAKRRCRSFEAWSDKTVRSVLADVLRRVTAESTGIATELLGQVGWVGTRAAAAARSAAAAGAAAVASTGRTVWGMVRSLFGVGEDAGGVEPA